MSSNSLRRLVAAGGVLAIALAGVACGDDSDDGLRTVTAVDYEFENLPETVKSGTQLRLRNTSEKEIHELVVFRLKDTEKRPVADLAKLSETEFEGLAATPGPPAMVLLRAPGESEQIMAVGDGTLTEAGRYMAVCFIPTGADPAAYLAASQTATDGPPQVAGGPRTSSTACSGRSRSSDVRRLRIRR